MGRGSGALILARSLSLLRRERRPLCGRPTSLVSACCRPVTVFRRTAPTGIGLRERRLPGDRLRSCPPGRFTAKGLRVETIRPSSFTSLRRSPGILRREPRTPSTATASHRGSLAQDCKWPPTVVRGSGVLADHGRAAARRSRMATASCRRTVQGQLSWAWCATVVFHASLAKAHPPKQTSAPATMPLRAALQHALAWLLRRTRP